MAGLVFLFFGIALSFFSLRNIMDKMWWKKFLRHSMFFFVVSLSLSSWSCSSHQNKTDGIAATADGEQNPVRVGNRKEIFESGKVIPKIYCKSNPSLSFALY